MKVITLNSIQFDQTVDQLSDKCSSFNPDVVIGILNGGSYVGKRIIQNNLFIKKKYYEVKLQRESTAKKESKLFPLVVKSLPYFITNMLRVYEAKKLAKKERNHSNEFHINVPELASSDKKALIVDDAIDSGETMQKICIKMKEKYPDLIIKTACVVCTTDNPVVLPDYQLYDQVLVRFPWSSDYKGKDRFV